MAIGLTHAEASSRPADDPPARRRRRPLLIAVIVLLVLILAALVGWIGLRAYLARQQLYAALPAANGVVDGIGSGDLAKAKASSAELSTHAAEAAALTSDPIWRLAEGIPWVGPNLAAARTVAHATDTVASEVVAPLISVAEQADPRTLKVTAGHVALAPLVAAQPVVAKARVAFHQAQAEIAGIRGDAVIQPLGSAVQRLDAMFGRAAPAVDAIGDTARLLPGMLGQSGVRNYLVVAQNPAELRATGGLIGSVALVRADHGAITLVAQQAGTGIGPWPEAVSDIPDATTGLYGPLVGRYLQDANATPDFPLAAETVATMWQRTHGGTVDGVVTLDPVVLSALLKATGPVTTESGDTLTADNAVPLLLSQVYSRYAEGWQQDAFFSSSASAVFDTVASGRADGHALVAALAAAGASDRLRLWSAHPDEQGVIASTTLAGALPVSTHSTAALGVYLNDGTGGKMDYYLGAGIAAGAAVCRADGTPTSLVQVTLRNTAPADAATSLPAYVTGDGHSGVPAGDILTRVSVYGPSGGLLAGASTGAGQAPAIAGTDGGRPVAVLAVQLAPGESRTVTVQFLNVDQKKAGLTVAATPLLAAPGVTPDVGAPTAVGRIADVCGSVIK